MNTKAVFIPLDEQKKRLSEMSESDFRDKVVRPLFLSLGYEDGRVLHGSDEEGKDILFIERTKLGESRVICIQTKKGNINMASDGNRHITTAVTQLRTALNTKVALVETKQKRYPDEVVLCVSGTINDKARKYICEELQKDTKIQFLDSNSLIGLIDKSRPEIWEGISANVFKHYDAIRRYVETKTLDIIAPHAQDGAFVSLNFYRYESDVVKHRGQYSRKLRIEEISLAELENQTANKGMNKPILIVGEAGSGKSTALWRIAYDVVRHKGRENHIPVVVPARDINSADIATVMDLVDEIKRVAADFSQSENLLGIDDIKQGRLILLIDAIDEIGDEKNRTKLIQHIIDLNSQYPSCTTIVTSRQDEKTRRAFRVQKAKIYDVAPISWKQVHKIVNFVLQNRKLSNADSESIAKDSKVVLRHMGEVHGFKITPLLATIYATSAEYSRSDIPANITELFKKYTELMLGRWDETKGLQQQYHAPLKDFVLREIAYSMHTQKCLRLTKVEFQQKLAALLSNLGHDVANQDIEKELIDRSRLLREAGQYVEFSHLLLQEFFAGRAMSEKEIAKKIESPWWDKPIMFYYGENSDKADHLRAVQQKIMKQPKQRADSHRIIGFALQASYLSVVSTKIDIWVDVVRAFSEIMVFIEKSEQQSLFSLSELVINYLKFRDAVAFSALRNKATAEKITECIQSIQDADPSIREATQLWHVIALLQSDLISEAADKIAHYHFDNKRYQLLIYMGALFISEVLPVDKSHKKAAHAICAKLEDKIAPYIKQFTKEFRSMLLEQQGDKVVAVQGDDEQ